MRRGISNAAGRLAAAVALFLAALGFPPAAAREWRVENGRGRGLAEVLQRAAAGDRVIVVGGRHRGPLVVDRALQIEGRSWPVIEGDGSGTVVTVAAAGTRISGFVIRGSGSSLDEENSGLAVDESQGTEIVGNRLEDVLFGIYLRKSPDSAILGNEIVGKRLDLPRRGDAIRVWYSDDVAIEDNRVLDSRDVVLWYSERLSVRRNRVSGGRYGLHFMYCDDASIAENLLTDNSVGAFLMYSRRLSLRRNTVGGNHGPSGFGVGLKDMDDAEIVGNRFVGNRVGAFLDNSPRESASRVDLKGNLFAGNDIGVSLLPNVERGRFLDNSFVENQQQVEIAGSGGEPSANHWYGNFWSSYVGYDADADGFGDLPFQANRLFEDLADRRPALRLFLYSPASQALEVAARTVPLIRPLPKLTDERPRMRPLEPQGCPRLPTSSGLGFRSLGSGMILLAGLLLVAPAAARRAERGGAGRGSSESGGDGGGPVVHARGVSKHFGDVAALVDVSFDIARGESVAVWGPNGAGKTTLLRVLLGVLPFSGMVRLAGVDPWRRGRTTRAAIGFVPQEVALQSDLGVDETLELFARLKRVQRSRISEVVQELGLANNAGKRVGDLSGGQRQRLALALALLSEPPILVLDEPTANLDARARADFLALLRDLGESGQTLLFSSHRPEEVLAVADRVLRLEGGRLVADGPASQALYDGGRRAEMWLLVEPDKVDAAAAVLADAGSSPRRLGAHVVIEVAADSKLEPIRRLEARGIRLLDFELDPVERRGDGDAE